MRRLSLADRGDRRTWRPPLHRRRKLAGEMTIQEILEDHPHLTREDILAAQEFAADYLAEEELAFG